jgi:protein phosphatase methylesterase 1
LCAGTALEALSHMHRILSARPKSFSSLEKAIEWRLASIVDSPAIAHHRNDSVRSGQVHNVTSARVSMPGQLVCHEKAGADKHERRRWR